MTKKKRYTKTISVELEKIIDQVMSNSNSASRGRTLIGNRSKIEALTPPQFRGGMPPIKLSEEDYITAHSGTHHQDKLFDKNCIPKRENAADSAIKTEEVCTTAAKDSDNFIRSLQVSYVNDAEVSVNVGGNKKKDYTCKEMGFRSSENGWKLLVEVLKEKDHLFDVGTYSKDKIPAKNKRYNQRQKWITQFTKKFITFINREYGTQISDKTKLLENQKNKNRDGLYKPIFQIASGDAIHTIDIKKLSKQAVLEKIEKIAADRKREKNAEVRDKLLSDIGVYTQHAAKKKWITAEQARIMISLPDEEVSLDDAMSLVDEHADINNR